MDQWATAINDNAFKIPGIGKILCFCICYNYWCYCRVSGPPKHSEHVQVRCNDTSESVMTFLQLTICSEHVLESNTELKTLIVTSNC